MKKILLTLLPIIIGLQLFGQLDTINIGTGANTGTGDPLRTAMIKTNAGLNLINTVQLYNINAAEMAILNGALASTTELNYLVGVTSAIQTQLNAKAATSHTQAQSTITSLSDSLLTRYTKTQANTLYNLKVNISDTASMLSPYAHNTYFESRVDSIVGVLADTANIETLFQIDLDTDTIADLSELRLKLNLADTASMLTHYALTSEIGAASTDSAVYATRYYVINSYLADADTASMLTPYINRADTASMLTNYINKADTAGMLTNYITSVEVAASYATKTSVHLHADTIPLFVFGGGGGNAGDTTTFTTSTIYGSFYNAGSDSLRITELRVIMLGDATDSLSVDILWDVNLNDGTPTELNSTPVGINSLTTGDTDTTFDVAKIPPGVWVWCETPYATVGRRPTYFNAQISGYKIPKY